MLTLDQIKAFYPDELHRFESFLLREYLQHKILEIVYEGPFNTKLCFMGGTCLRIVHGFPRFSEDLDFDNFGLRPDDFSTVADSLEKQLSREGFAVEMRKVMRSAYHCYLKFPNLLFDSGLSGHREEKILIQLDTEPQEFDFQPESHILNKFDIFTRIRTTPVDLLLSQKLFAVCNRPRPKGRDFFDITYLWPKTKPNYRYLRQKMGIDTPSELKESIRIACRTIDFEAMVRDARAFLFRPADEKRIRLFREWWEEVEV